MMVGIIYSCSIILVYYCLHVFSTGSGGDDDDDDDDAIDWGN